MKHSIRLTQPDGEHVYLSHRGKAAFAPATAKKYLREYLAANPGAIARLETQDREPVETVHTAKRLVIRARRLYNLRLVDPRSPQYSLADSLMERANLILSTLETVEN